MKPPGSFMRALLPWLLPAPGAAQGITDIVSENRSTANSSVSDPHGAQEFGSFTAVPAPVLDGGVASFRHRMAWFDGLLTDPPPGAFRQASAHSAYSLTFTVQDPSSRGHALHLQSALRGVLQARGGGFATAQATLEPRAVSVWPAFETASITLPALGTRPHGVTTGGPVAEDEIDVDGRGRATVGRWAATRSFLVVVEIDPSSWVTLGRASDPALAFMQFGLGPRALALGAGFETGSGSPPLDELGHGLTVQAIDDSPPAPVPVPASWALLVAARSTLRLRRRFDVRP